MAKHKQNVNDPLTPEQREYIDTGGASGVTLASVPDSGEKKRGKRQPIPPELRSYYVVFGVARHGGNVQRIGRFKSRKRADNWALETRELLVNNYASLEIVRCKRMAFVEFNS